MANRYPRSQREAYSRNDNPDFAYDRQEEQFQADLQDRYSDDGITSDRGYGDRNFGDAGYDRSRQSMGGNRSQYRQQTGSASRYSPLDDYDRASDDFRRSSQYTQSSGTHGSFRGDSFGGEAMTGPSGSGSYADYGMRPTSGGYTGSYSGSDDRPQHDRGFFERAGDEIASWFGDDDAERRRRMDHSGRGPANYTRSNERLLEHACERLTEDRGVDASNISVTCDDSEVTLDGTVNTRWEKRRAEDCVHDISGVKHVQNNLRIAQPEMRAGMPNTDTAS